MRLPFLSPVHVLTPALALLLSACSSLTPSTELPAAPVPATWPTGAAYAPATGVSIASAAALPWQDFVQDVRLRAVITQALANNRDLRQAAANIASARATYGVQQAAVVPTLTGSVGGSRARSLSNTATNDTTTSQSASATVGLSAYEIDLFGKVRSLSQSALETYLATEEGARATRISLIAEIATAWLTLGSDSSRLALAQRTVQSAEQTVTLSRKRLEAGVASRIDLSAAETTYQQARVDVASLTTTVAQDRNALELLVGQPVADAQLPTALPEGDAALTQVSAGLSSSVLLQRPDVRQAEHKLLAANANITAARAAFFPSFKLTASGGLASGALAGLFSGGAASIWSIAPSLSLPIFDGGSRQASLEVVNAQRDLVVAAYEEAVQTSFREVADALARRGTLTDQLQAQTALVAAARSSYQLAEARYRLGVDSYLALQVAQRTLNSAEQTLITTRLTELGNRVTLYRVLGGGLAQAS
jgi:multidrug efflux system outer membrane protein